nr:MAG TPA: hypothetical protein [Caudoviricetes sp.]
MLLHLNYLLYLMIYTDELSVYHYISMHLMNPYTLLLQFLLRY